MGKSMANLLSKVLFRIVLVLTIGLVVVSCGRRGNLEAPPRPDVISVDEQGNEVRQEEETKEDKSFILDPLL